MRGELDTRADRGVAVVIAVSLVSLIRRIGRDRRAAELHPESEPDTPR